MPNSSRPYPNEFRQRMIDLAVSGRAPEDLAREFDCSAATIATWVAQYQAPVSPEPACDAAVAAAGGAPLSALERAELLLLREEVARLRGQQAALQVSQSTMALAIEGSGTGIWDRNIATGEIHYSAGWKALLGYTEAELDNRIEASYTRVHPEDLPYVQATIKAHFDGATPGYAVEHRIRCKDGSYKWISSRGKVVSRDAAGRPLRMIGTTTDITALHELSERLQQGMDLITNLTNEVPGLVFQYRLHSDGRSSIPYASEGINDMYELAPRQVAFDATPVHRLVHPDDFVGYRASLETSAAQLTPWHLEYRVVLPRQGLRWRQGDARPHRQSDGSTIWFGFITDVTERKRIETELHVFATTDYLTQLPNRRHFMVRIEQELARLRGNEGAQTAVLMCDLDHFKLINDGYGHALGDRVLQHFAAIVNRGLRKNDVVGRFGGEEFAIVLPDTRTEEACAFAHRLQQRIAQAPLREGGHHIVLTVSIGIAAMSNRDASAHAVLSRSDKALYRAKTNGRNRIEVD